MLWALSAHVLAGQAPKLVVDQRSQLVEGGRVALAPVLEQAGDLVGFGHIYIGACGSGEYSGPGFYQRQAVVGAAEEVDGGFFPGFPRRGVERLLP
jgi:hypothetical protein